MSAPDLKTLPGLVLDGDEPVFNEPWQAKAFAMAVSLNAQGLFTWTEWAEALSAELVGDNDAENYYHHWMAALEKLAIAKQATDRSTLSAREQAWHDAAARTPHGDPIELVK